MMTDPAATQAYIANCLTPLVGHLAATPLPAATVAAAAAAAAASADGGSALDPSASASGEPAAAVATGGGTSRQSAGATDQPMPEEVLQQRLPAVLVSSGHRRWRRLRAAQAGSEAVAAAPGLAGGAGAATDGAGPTGAGHGPAGHAWQGQRGESANASTAFTGESPATSASVPTYSSAILGWDILNEPEGMSWALRLYHSYM
jgi:hypothetical protein